MFVSILVFLVELLVLQWFAQLIVMPISVFSKPVGAIFIIPAWVVLTVSCYASRFLEHLSNTL